MRTCYLHLGMPKTGSSSIQSAFDGFETDGLAYARLTNDNHGPALCKLFGEQSGAAFISRKPDSSRLTGRLFGRKAPASDLRSRFEAALALRKDVVFSGEILVDRLDADALGRLVSELRAHAQRVVAIIYIRPLASLAASQFQQRVRTGQRRFLIPSPEYRRRFQKVVDLFDPNDIVWRRFDRDDLRDGDIVSDFAHVVGIQKPAGASPVRNESLSTEALAAIYAFNRFTAPMLDPAVEIRLRARLLERLRNAGSTRFGFAPALIQRHLEQYADEIAWMGSVCGFDVAGIIQAVPYPVSGQAQLLDLAAAIGDKARVEAKKLS